MIRVDFRTKKNGVPILSKEEIKKLGYAIGGFIINPGGHDLCS